MNYDDTLALLLALISLQKISEPTAGEAEREYDNAIERVRHYREEHPRELPPKVLDLSAHSATKQTMDEPLEPQSPVDKPKNKPKKSRRPKPPLDRARVRKGNRSPKLTRRGVSRRK